MKRSYQLHLAMALIVAVLVVAFTAPLTAAPTAQPGPVLPQDHSEEELCGGIQAPNLLVNPSFEGRYHAYVPPGGHPDCNDGVCNTAQMAEGWTPYWLSNAQSADPEIVMPEYKPAELWHEPARVHDGQRAQQYFSFSRKHEAGFYQQVAVTPGALYCFGIWGHAWSTETDNPYFNDSELEQAIGIDPTGGADWRSPNVIWGGPKQYYYEAGEESAYGPFSLVVRAQSSQLTVFTWSRPVWAVKHNDVYWDDAILIRAPQEPTLSDARNEIALIAPPDEATVYSIPIDISIANDPGVIWRASVQDGNTLAVNLAPPVGDGAAGTAFSDLVISFDSAPYSLGSFEANILIEADPPIPGSPQAIRVTLNIMDEIYSTAIPLFSK